MAWNAIVVTFHVTNTQEQWVYGTLTNKQRGKIMKITILYGLHTEETRKNMWIELSRLDAIT